MSATETADLIIGRAWVIDCARCSNEGMSFTAQASDAQWDFIQQGWTREGDMQFCPACNGVKGWRG